MKANLIDKQRPSVSLPENLNLKIEYFIRDFPTPKSLRLKLKEKILGQDEALMGICVNLWFYLLSLTLGTPALKSYNTLLVGPSGSGKTEIYRCVKKILCSYGIPCTISDTSSITPSGYKGRDKDEVLIPLIRTRGIGVVFLDEFDKILIPSYSRSDTNFNYETQASFLTMIEGNDNIMITDTDGTQQKVSTTRTMFVCMGAFEGMKRKGNEVKHSLGFANEEEAFGEADEISHDSIVDDIISYGCRRELIGRFHSIYELKPLSAEHRKVLFERALDRYEQLLGCKIEIVFDDIVSYIIGSVDDETGSRGIERRFKEYMDDILFNYSYENKPENIAILDKGVYEYADSSPEPPESYYGIY